MVRFSAQINVSPLVLLSPPGIRKWPSWVPSVAHSPSPWLQVALPAILAVSILVVAVAGMGTLHPSPHLCEVGQRCW